MSDGIDTPELYVTNFNPRLTGVSTTAAAVARLQQKRFRLAVVGHSLPGCSPPISRWEALRLSRRVPRGRPFSIWHVRRNSEMFLGVIARDLLRLPIRLVFSSAAQRRHSLFPRWLVSRMDAVIATSTQAASYVPNVFAVVPHGVDCYRFRPNTDRRAAWAATGYPGSGGVATVGRIRPEKGTDLFVDTMIRVLPRHPELTALVIGEAYGRDDSFKRALIERVEQAGLSERILFIGEVLPDRLATLLPGLSLFVALPRYEGYGMTVLEAMAAGVPVVASDAGHFVEFSDGGRLGSIVPVGDVDAAANASEEILASALHQHRAEEARNYVLANYSLDREVRALNDVAERLRDVTS